MSLIILAMVASALTLAPTAWSASTALQRIVVVGDSLSAEYGLPRGQGWVSLLQQRVRSLHPQWGVDNASISGDTTAGGVARLSSVLAQQHPTMVLIELGANDALRGLPLSQTRINLQRMIRECRAAGAQVVLIGMQIPPNFGPSYTQEFADTFTQVAAQEKAALVPFLLKGIADRPDARAWFQADGLHPVAAAQPRMLDNVWSVIEPLWRGHVEQHR